MAALPSPTPLARPQEALLLDPPRGYRVLAWLGLVLSVLVVPAAVAWILADPVWRVTNIAVGAGAVLPTAVLGLVGSIALIRWRHWGQVLAIIALSLALAISVPYAIVRLILVEQGRLALALSAPLVWGVATGSLIFWCRPAIRHYLR